MHQLRATAVLVLLLAAAVPEPAAALRWPVSVFDSSPPAPALTAQQCRELAGGQVHRDEPAAFASLAAFLGIDGPVLRPPMRATDVTTLDTLVKVRFWWWPAAGTLLFKCRLHGLVAAAT